MLTRERAQELLKEFHVEDWTARRQAQVQKLPRALRPIGAALLESFTPHHSLSEWESRQKAWHAAIEKLDALGTKDRLCLFEALFPRLSTYVERAWQLHVNLPYQTSRAFRAPKTPLTTRWARDNWLSGMIQSARGYEQDIIWFAAWAPYLSYYGTAPILGILFAAAIDTADEAGRQVYEILLASARGEHEVGAFGHHVTQALLVSSRPEAWAFMESLLLAAQRQEGLRQAILETIDMAHPEAFRRMLRLIVQHDLARFSATIRALDVWLGFRWEAEKVGKVNQVLERLLELLENHKARAQALKSEDGEQVYLALWTMAFEDAVATVKPAAALLGDAKVERRFAAAYLLSALGLVAGFQALYPAIEDSDLRVAVQALLAIQRVDPSTFAKIDLFERLERILPRFPSTERALPPIIWPWVALSASQEMVARALLQNLGKRSPKRLIPYLPKMSPSGRTVFAGLLASQETWDRETRNVLIDLLGDPSSSVRANALTALEKAKIEPPDAPPMEALLTRSAADLRHGILTLLLRQKDSGVLSSIDRLLGQPNAQQRLAGLELVHEMIRARRRSEDCQAKASHYQRNSTRLTDTERVQLDIILGERAKPPSLEDALGLMDPQKRTRPTPPRRELWARFHNRPLVTPAAIAVLRSLDDLVEANRSAVVAISILEGTKEELLGNIRWGLPQPNPKLPLEQDLLNCPLRETWDQWWSERGEHLRDADGLEMLRALAPVVTPSPFSRYTSGEKEEAWLKEACRMLLARPDLPNLKYPYVISTVLQWLVRMHPPSGAADWLIDAIEFTFALVPPEELQRRPDPQAWYTPNWRNTYPMMVWLDIARTYRAFCPAQWTNVHRARFWGLVRWMDEPIPGAWRCRPSLEETWEAFYAGVATRDDMLDLLIGPRDNVRGWMAGFDALRRLTGRQSQAQLHEAPEIREMVDSIRERILAIETVRGDLPTAASAPALSVRSLEGAQTLARLLRGLGRESLVRGHIFTQASRAAVLSHLIRSTFPSSADTPETLATALREGKVPDKRVIELAVYAPQWASYVEACLGWPGLADAVWWIHAHTKDAKWHVDQEIREGWAAEVTERTPLSGPDLIDGAVDVTWFEQVYRQLGEERWTQVYAAGKLASSATGHARALLFADAMLGRVSSDELVGRVTKKRHQDAVRALGLVPLPEGEARLPELNERYRVVQEFVRTGRQFGSQRQASEKRAATIALQNLACTAGYKDPLRLEWDMEARAMGDLTHGPLTVTAGDTTVALSIDSAGTPELAVTRDGKMLKSIPTESKKNPAVVELQARKRELEHQAARVRQSLEGAMCRGDAFSGAELRTLFGHPMLAPMIGNLLFWGADGTGYPVDGGTALCTHDGQLVTVGTEARLGIAHSYDLWRSQEWPVWQRECFMAGRVQPFKQIFRELYILTPAEVHEGTQSRRYAGHQVQTRQALALLGQRGWISHPEQGTRRTFHEEDLSAWVTFNQGILTPAEVEGLVIETVHFTRRGDWHPIELKQIPPRVFSEVMRDLDLVVSVAHAGGVDPEASASTVEMRAALVAETAKLMKLDNVRIQGAHVLVEGQLGHYSVHLGSAVAHRQPGGAICIVAVPSQQRGRLFLPFADNDPKTAEVVSKVLLLARDKEIRDPVILEQLLARA